MFRSIGHQIYTLIYIRCNQTLWKSFIYPDLEFCTVSIIVDWK